MRVSLLVSALFALASSVNSQTCPFSSAQCPSTPAAVPTPWYNADFATDPRLNPSVGGIASAGYSWLATAPGDACAQFHQGLINLPGAPLVNNVRNSSDLLGPHVDLGTASGPYSIGTTFPGLIGGAGSGSLTQGTQGWSFEVTVRPAAEGGATNWAKFVNLGTSARLRTGTCNGEWLVGWQGSSDSVSMSTCVAGREDKIENFLASAPDNQWMHFVSVIQYSASIATYFIYYNGNLIGTGRFNSQKLAEVVRDRAYLGRSSWADAYYNGTIDHFAVYDVALTAPQALGLYGEKMNGCTVTRTPYQNITNLPSDVVAPVFDAAFTANITTFPTVPADFSWVREDPEDVQCGVNTQHQGLLSLAGDADWTPSISAGPFVNLSSTGGENYIGQTIVTFGNVTVGAGNVSTLSAGFSIETVFKASFQNPSAKIFDAGNSKVNGDCSPGDIWAGWSGVNLNLEIKYCDRQNNYRTIVDGTIALQLRTWYHMVITFTQMPDSTVVVNVYMNGQAVMSLQNQAMLPYVYRSNVLLGRSQFFGSTDTYFSGMIDRFAIYNRSLSPVQVASLANTAGTRSCIPSANTLTTVPSNAVFYRVAFDNDPRGAGAQFGWTRVDSNDTAADQAIHQGVLLMGCNRCTNNDAGLSQWVNLTATSGPNALSNTPALGWFGGEGNGDFLAGTKGWTFEASFKIYPTRDTVFDATTKVITDGSNGQSWAKVFDIGDGNKGSGRDQCENDVIFGFNSGNNYMKFQSCTPIANDQSVGDTSGLRRAMKVNTWYHLVVTMQLLPQGTNASMYLDGSLVESKILRVYPLLASRQDGRIGDSSWSGDPYFNGALDMFTIYSQAVNPQQVSAMYAAATSPAAVTSSSSTGTTVRSSSSSTAAVVGSSSSSTGTNVVVSSSSSTTPRSSSSSSSGTATSVPTGTSVSSGTSVPTVTSVPTGTSVSNGTSVPSVTSGTSVPAVISSSSSSSAMVYPAGSVRVSMNAILPETVNAGNFERYRSLLEQDIIQNLANVTNVTASSLSGQVQVTSINGVTSGARRLLQSETPVVFVILGTISNVVTNFGNDASQVATRVANALSDRAAAGQFTATNSGATVPAQTLSVSPANNDASTGVDGPNGAASLSQSFALTVLCAVIALMAL